MYIQQESVRCILIKIKFFSNVKGFHNEHGYISYFNFIFCFYNFNKFGHIQSFPIIWFNICFFLNLWYNGHSSKTWNSSSKQFRIIRTWVRNKAYCLRRIEKRESVMERHEIHDINVHDIQINKVDILKSDTYIEF